MLQEVSWHVESLAYSALCLNTLNYSSADLGGRALTLSLPLSGPPLFKIALELQAIQKLSTFARNWLLVKVPEKPCESVTCHRAPVVGGEPPGRLFQKGLPLGPCKGLIPGTESRALSCARSKWFWHVVVLGLGSDNAIFP